MKREPREIYLKPLEAKLNDYELKIGDGEGGSIALTKEELERIHILIINELSAYVMVE